MGTETFCVIWYEHLPVDRRKEVSDTKVVCEVRPPKEDPNRTRITIEGNRIIYPGDVATPTASLELVNTIINSVLYLHGEKFSCFDIKNFYLATPIDRSEYVKIKIDDIPAKFIEEYDLLAFTHNGWVYFETVRGWYGLPQSGKLANNLLCMRLNKAGYFEAAKNQGYVNTPSFLSNFALSLMTLELNMWVKTIPTTFSKSSNNIMKY